MSEIGSPQIGFSVDLARLRIQLTADAGAALLALLVATALAVYKPRGMTGYGARKEHQQVAVAPRWAKLLVTTIVLVLVALGSLRTNLRC
jgi:hypothetical protein